MVGQQPVQSGQVAVGPDTSDVALLQDGAREQAAVRPKPGFGAQPCIRGSRSACRRPR